MTEEWHVSANGQRVGPIARQQLEAMAAKGDLRPNDWVWQQGMADWAQAESVPGLFQSPRQQVAAAEINQLERLARLREKGLLTPQEFAIKKEQILRSITSPASAALPKDPNGGTYWLSITSLILGIFSVLGAAGIDHWGSDEVAGVILFVGAALGLGIASVRVDGKGKGMGIAGIVLSVLAVLVALGSHS